MAKRFWKMNLPEFVSKIAPPFVRRSFEIQDGSSERFEWLAKKITMEEFEAGLSLYNNSALAEDGIRSGILKVLPIEMNAPHFERHSFEWRCSRELANNKDQPILKPGIHLSNSDSTTCYLILERYSRKLF
jgi:hypothetical protein